jgi:predicted Zn-dependent protease
MAKEQVPDNPFMSDTLGWVYYKKNVYSRAIVYLKDAADKMPNQPVVHYHLGMAYYKNGQMELAKKELARALQIDPNFPGAAEAQEVLQKAK